MELACWQVCNSFHYQRTVLVADYQCPLPLHVQTSFFWIDRFVGIFWVSENLWLPWEIYWGVTYGVRREDRRQIVPTGVCERGEGRKIGRKKKKFFWGKNWPSTRFLEFEEKFSPLLSPDICWQFSWWWERQTWEELREWEVKWENKRQRFPTKKIQDPTLWRRTSGFAIKKISRCESSSTFNFTVYPKVGAFPDAFSGLSAKY